MSIREELTNRTKDHSFKSVLAVDSYLSTCKLLTGINWQLPNYQKVIQTSLKIEKRIIPSHHQLIRRKEVIKGREIIYIYIYRCYFFFNTHSNMDYNDMYVSDTNFNKYPRVVSNIFWGVLCVLNHAGFLLPWWLKSLSLIPFIFLTSQTGSFCLKYQLFRH